MKSVDEHVAVYGEKYRKLIADSLNFLDENETHWKLDRPMNRDKFVREVMSKICKDDDEKDKKRTG